MIKANSAKAFGNSRLRVRRLLLVTVLAGMGIAGYLAYNVWSRIGALDSAKQDHAEWVYTQLEVEFLKADRALTQAQSGTPEALDEFRKRFDIFYSRALLAERARSSPEENPSIAELRGRLDRLLPLIDGNDAALMAGMDDVTVLMRDIEHVPREIALKSIATAAEFAQNERNEIVRLIESTGATALVVTLALVAAIFRLSRQASRLDLASRTAQINELRLATTLRASLDAIVVIGEDGAIRDFNGSAEEIFGISRAEAIGRDYVDLMIPPSHREQQRRNLQRFQKTGETVVADKGRREFEMVDQHGRVFPVELSVSLSPSKEGRLFIAYIRDITDKREREAEIIKARDEALDAYQEKSRFFAMMSHEMRTPLNGVISALQLLQDDRLEEDQQRYLNAATTSGEILLEHINDVLAIERSEVGTYDQVQQACDITALTAGIIGTMDPLAQSSGTRLHIDQTGLTDQTIMTNPRAIQQVLVNLMSNAIKFSPNGNVTMRAWFAAHPIHKQKNELWLQVEDDGPGIPSKDIERIFEDFVSLDSRYERLTGGTGLGLGIVRRLAHRLGGQITCDSVVGAGTCFTLRLPAIPAKANETFSRSTPEIEQGKTSRLRLLVADDNQINRDLIEAMLHKIGHDVTLVTGGQEAIDVARQKRFDAILMDISMPRVNGIQAARTILNEVDPNRDTPIIAVTAHALPQEQEEFVAVGMKGFLQKPLNLQLLRLRLSEISPHSESEGHIVVSANGSTADVAPAFPNTSLLNEHQIVDLLDLLGEAKLADRVAHVVERLERDLPALVGAKTVEDIQPLAHAMAGMCGMLGAEQLHGILEDIETACKEGDARQARQLLGTLPEVWRATHVAWNERLGL